MARVCAVCASDNRREIDKMIAAGKPLIQIERKWGIGDDSLKHHRESGHVLRAVAAGAAKAEIARSLDAAAELVATYRQVEERLNETLRDADFFAGVKAKTALIDLALKANVDLPTEKGVVKVKLNMDRDQTDAETG